MKIFIILLLTNACVLASTINELGAITVSGQVTDTEGTPVEEARITFTNEADTSKAFSGMTDMDGRYRVMLEVITVVEEETVSAAPKTFHLFQNYPNPFNPSTLIPYQLEDGAPVRLAVYNMLGQPVRTLVDEVRPAGVHTATWDGRDEEGKGVGAGVYFVGLEAGGFTQSRKMLLLDGTWGAGMGVPAPPSAKQTVPTQEPGDLYTVAITGADIVPLSRRGVSIQADTTTLNFEVVSLQDQVALEGDFTIRSQEDLDGLVAMEGSSVSITGDLKVEESPLVTLADLEHLTSIGGNLWISNNAALTSLAGLENITSIGGDLWIVGNAALTSLAGLENITSIGGSLWISGNAALTNSLAEAFADRLAEGGFTGEVSIAAGFTPRPIPDATTPEQLMDNLARALRDRDIDLYETLIDEDFWFTETDCAGELLFANGREEELEVMGGSRDGSTQGIFDSFRIFEYDFTLIKRSTELGPEFPEAFPGDPDGHPDEDWEVFRGRVSMLLMLTADDGFRVEQDMNFKLREVTAEGGGGEAGLWKIVRWDDPLSGGCDTTGKILTETYSWGLIKALMR